MPLPLKNTSHSLIFILFCGILTACSGSPGESLSDGLSCSDEVSGIVNGYQAQKQDELSSSTVLILTENSKKEVSVCTGTLIDSNVVLTAAHCSAPKMYVSFVRNAGCLSKMDNVPLRKVTRSIIRKEKLPDNMTLASDDLLLVRFAGSSPSGFFPRALPDKNLQLSGSETLLMAGYGKTRENAEDSGILRFTESSAQNLLSQIYFPQFQKSFAVDRTLILDQRRTGVCKGDSGGPLFIKSSYGLTLLGITSMGVDNVSTDGKSDKVCQGVALFTDVRAHLDWIREGVKALRRAAF